MPGDFGDVNPDTGHTSARTQFEGTLDPLAPSVANGQISPEQWAEYQRRRRRNMILGLAGTIGGAMGAGALTSAIGGAGSAAGSAAGGSLPPLSGGAPWAVSPYVGTASMVSPTTLTAAAGGIGAGAAGLGTAGVAGAARNFLGLSPQDWMTLIPALAGTIGTAVQRPPNMAPNTQTTDPNLQQLIQTMQGRLTKSEPLYDSIMAMANGLLPTQYQKGGGGMP